MGKGSGRGAILSVALAAALSSVAACAIGSSADDSGGSGAASGGDAPSETVPDDPFARPDGGAPSSSGGSSSGSASSSGGSSGGTSSGGSTSSGGTSSGGSTSSSGGSSGGSTSSSGGSSSGGSSSGGSSSGAAGGACGVCDRNWTCNGFPDYWATTGARCINQRTTTALRCDGHFDQGNSYDVGTWSGNASHIVLTYPMLGGGTKTYDCFP